MAKAKATHERLLASVETTYRLAEKNFDRLLDLKQASDWHEIERFCKYDVNTNLSLVWVKRLF